WFLTCWVLGPLALLSLNQSKLPQYVLPLMPAIALAAARVLARDGIAAAGRLAAGLLALLGAVLVLAPRLLTQALPLAQSVAAAIPPAAVAVGIALLVAAALVALAARSGTPAHFWLEVLARCVTPTVFVTHDGLPGPRTWLQAALPLLADNGHYSAYGPCKPRGNG